MTECICPKCKQKTAFLQSTDVFSNNDEYIEIVECVECGYKIANIYKFNRTVDLSMVLNK
jgi:uncharacterized metal-binding protein (TIGR02443 family)